MSEVAGTLDAELIGVAGTLDAELLEVAGTLDAEMLGVAGTLDVELLEVADTLDGELLEVAGTLEVDMLGVAGSLEAEMSGVASSSHVTSEGFKCFELNGLLTGIKPDLLKKGLETKEGVVGEETKTEGELNENAMSANGLDPVLPANPIMTGLLKE